MANPSTKEIQNKNKEILLAFIDLCKELNIKYYAIGGTLLGAVRHKGFIPWDDDIDIGIPREDYEKFISSAKKINSDFVVSCPEIFPDARYSFIKIYHTKTTAEENFALPEKKGLWIDIFPIDKSFNNKKLCNIHFSISSVMKKVLAIKRKTFYTTNKSNITVSILYFINLLLKPFSSELLYSFQKKILTINSKKEKNNSGNFLGRWGPNEIVPSYIFHNSQYLDFEDIKISAPYNSHEYLKSIYGDYMKLPPENQRGGHDRSGINLDKGWKDND